MSGIRVFNIDRKEVVKVLSQLGEVERVDCTQDDYVDCASGKKGANEIVCAVKFTGGRLLFSDNEKWPEIYRILDENGLGCSQPRKW